MVSRSLTAARSMNPEAIGMWEMSVLQA